MATRRLGVLFVTVAAAALATAAADSSTGAAVTEVNLTPAVQSAIDSRVRDSIAAYTAHLAQDTDLTEALDASWMLLTAFLVFFMQAGFALVEAGAVGSKDIIAILLKNCTDFAIST